MVRFLEVLLKDKIYPVWVKQCYKAYKGTDIITTWVEIGNAGKKPVTLFQFASAYFADVSQGQLADSFSWFVGRGTYDG